MSNIDKSDFQKAKRGRGQIVVVNSKATANKLCDYIIEGIGRDVIHTKQTGFLYGRRGEKACTSYYVTITVKRRHI